MFFRKFVIKTIEIYQAAVSPYLMKSCRFHPSCSFYSKEAVQKHGILKGGSLSAARLLRCNPFSKGGYDPVPAKE